MVRRDRAVHLTMRAPHVLSHDSAARALGIDVAVPRERLVHVASDAEQVLVTAAVGDDLPGNLDDAVAARFAVTMQDGVSSVERSD